MSVLRLSGQPALLLLFTYFVSTCYSWAEKMMMMILEQYAIIKKAFEHLLWQIDSLIRIKIVRLIEVT
jgi:hypothetical protein